MQSALKDNRRTAVRNLLNVTFWNPRQVMRGQLVAMAAPAAVALVVAMMVLILSRWRKPAEEPNNLPSTHDCTQMWRTCTVDQVRVVEIYSYLHVYLYKLRAGFSRWEAWGQPLNLAWWVI